MFKNKGEKDGLSWSPRTLVLSVLGTITLGVAVLSVAVSYRILVPHFGGWAAPTVAALDALWVVLQATEILAGNNTERAARVRRAGLFLTAVIAAVPTADLIQTGTGEGLGLAVVLTPVAIVSTKGVWWLVLPSLGRKVSPATRQAIATRRQEVADRIEQMEADAADKEELLRVAQRLNERVTRAETDYRLSALKAQQTMIETLHAQAETTATTISEKSLPALVARIELPELDGWEPSAPTLPVTSRGAAVTLEDLAAVKGVPVPRPGEPLDDDQLDVVVRYLRYSEDPPRSYRATAKALHAAGFISSEERVRHACREMKRTEAADAGASETADEDGAEEPYGA
ncbi:hypothetical protein L0F81_39910 [Streptomyces tricolor]|uniref:Uncharacterized protein n=1 Tax=Streptomyces tricolor TaxID=68277 RepID=A0ABS9JUW6_9ACTN|nr:hypothetical protein [Streptomyces tricolor]MCG0069361.1 hypothetical protein [Streptomyces tricolor]